MRRDDEPRHRVGRSVPHSRRDAPGLPAGPKLDATGTDAGGCTAADLPTGTAPTWATAPRTVPGA